MRKVEFLNGSKNFSLEENVKIIGDNRSEFVNVTSCESIKLTQAIELLERCLDILPLEYVLYEEVKSFLEEE